MSKIKVISYQSSWPKKYEIEAKKIKEALGVEIVALHHIGSTSVEGLSAKEDIDILCVVKNLKKSLLLQSINYVFKGELNIPLRYFFSKNTEFSKVNLHVVESDHGFISLNLTFRDYLRKHPSICKEYEALKFEILKDSENHQKMPSGHCTKYGACKDKFIKKVLKKADFNDLTINFCHHQSEWEACEELLGPIEELEKVDPHFVYFILYLGTEIVAGLKASKGGEILKIRATTSEYLDELKKWYKKWKSN